MLVPQGLTEDSEFANYSGTAWRTRSAAGIWHKVGRRRLRPAWPPAPTSVGTYSSHVRRGDGFRFRNHAHRSLYLSLPGPRSLPSSSIGLPGSRSFALGHARSTAGRRSGRRVIRGATGLITNPWR